MVVKNAAKKIANIIYKALTIMAVLYVAKLAIQILFIASFRIPSDSMYPTLIAGDKVIVNKMLYGARIFNPLDSIKHGDIRRTWGSGKPQRNDIMVFNYPYPHDKHIMSFNVLKYYIKRCIALPGDTIEIRDGYYHVRGSNDTLGIHNSQKLVDEYTRDSISIARSGIAYGAFPRRRFIPWTIRNLGPFYLPKQGDTITINRDNMLLYGRIIEWEEGEAITERDSMYYIGDTVITHHIMHQGCYFMAGDNAVNSRDSRYWGLVPEEFIVGKATMTWTSINPNNGSICWERVLSFIE